MTTLPIRPVGEDDLLRHVDGVLPPDQAAAVERAAAADPALAARLQADRAAIEAIHAAFDPVLGEAVPARLREAGTGRGTAPRPHAAVLARIAAALALLAVGAGAGWFARGQLMPGPAGEAVAVLPHAAATAHRVFAVEVRHPVEVGANEEAHLVQWLSRRLGSSIRAPQLADFGYQLVGGRLLVAAGGPAAQLMYQTAAGQRLTLFVATNPDNRETAFRFAEDNGDSVFYWYDGPLGYALSGEIGRAELLPIARAVYDRLSN
jgi:anti-sigma factor RsiW